MDLETFVAETLRQVVTAVRSAQQSMPDGGINAEKYGEVSGHLMSGGRSGMFTRVDFDVAVSAETSAQGKAALTVFGVGASGGGEHKHGYANRVSFSVPVRLPDGMRVPETSDYGSGGTTSGVRKRIRPRGGKRI
jgi:hypothetical protein